jgi:hypothetical protein
MKLCDVAHARSGDKGNVSNIVVVARSADVYRKLVEVLTADAVKTYFDGIVLGEVHRYELPQLSALNFVMHGSLQGGVTRSTALDAHGKSMAFALLNMTL